MWLVFCYFVIKYVKKENIKNYVKKENIKNIWILLKGICLKIYFKCFFLDLILIV